LSNIKKHILFALLLFTVVFSIGVKAIHSFTHLHDELEVCTSQKHHYHEDKTEHHDFICETKFSFFQIDFTSHEIQGVFTAQPYYFSLIQLFSSKLFFSSLGRSPPFAFI
tara:strand:- start:5944 stop:6273 length:330 start_codon:yes stop_codon:yes gene_type:complete